MFKFSLFLRNVCPVKFLYPFVNWKLLQKRTHFEFKGFFGIHYILLSMAFHLCKNYWMVVLPHFFNLVHFYFVLGHACNLDDQIRILKQVRNAFKLFHDLLQICALEKLSLHQMEDCQRYSKKHLLSL